MTVAGQLSERFAFEEPTLTDDSYGGTTEGFTERVVASARRVFKRGGEGVLAARLEGKQPAIITVRSSLGARAITPAWRARDVRTGALYNIRSVEPTEDRAWLEMLIEGGVVV